MYSVASAEELAEALMLAPGARILGGGSNILAVNKEQPPIVRMGIKGISVVAEHPSAVKIRVGAGEVWHHFVEWCVDQDFGGLENLALIPGTVGAAPIQNIGAYGVEQDTCFVELQALDRESGKLITVGASHCGFGYRTSMFKACSPPRYVITHVTYRLSKSPHSLNTTYKDVATILSDTAEPTIRNVFDAVVGIRRKKLPDPSVVGNAGSFFKNPVISADSYQRMLSEHPTMPSHTQPDGRVKVPAAWLIDEAGWKGYRKGAYGVHTNQALVLINYGGATGIEIANLARDIQRSVVAKFSVTLETEVNLW